MENEDFISARPSKSTTLPVETNIARTNFTFITITTTISLVASICILILICLLKKMDRKDRKHLKRRVSSPNVYVTAAELGVKRSVVQANAQGVANAPVSHNEFQRRCANNGVYSVSASVDERNSRQYSTNRSASPGILKYDDVISVSTLTNRSQFRDGLSFQEEFNSTERRLENCYRSRGLDSTSSVKDNSLLDVPQSIPLNPTIIYARVKKCRRSAEEKTLQTERQENPNLEFISNIENNTLQDFVQYIPVDSTIIYARVKKSRSVSESNTTQTEQDPTDKISIVSQSMTSPIDSSTTLFSKVVPTKLSPLRRGSVNSWSRDEPPLVSERHFHRNRRLSGNDFKADNADAYNEPVYCSIQDVFT